MNKIERKLCEEIIDRFGEAIYYKIIRDINLYGVCIMKPGDPDELDELIEIRKRLDRVVYPKA